MEPVHRYSSGEHVRQSQLKQMTLEIRIALFLVVELLAALRANEPDTFKQWIAEGVADLGEPAVLELLIDWFNPLLTQEEADRFVGCHLGVSL